MRFFACLFVCLFLVIVGKVGSFMLGFAIKVSLRYCDTKQTLQVSGRGQSGRLYVLPH